MATKEDDRVALLLDLDVVWWRFNCLEKAGYPQGIAASLAENASIDLHDAVELLRRGCPVEQAVDILT